MSTGRGRSWRSALRVLRTSVVVLVLLAGAVAGGTYVVRQRLAEAARIDIGPAVLTADPVPVGSADAGIVTDVFVAEQTQVSAGQDLAQITLPVTGTSPTPPVRILRAPTAGTVSTVEVRAGSVARAGEPLITLYDQNSMTFEAKVPMKQLRRLRLGMAATITGTGLDRPVTAVLDHVVPRVGTEPTTTTDRLTVVFVPLPGDVERVSRLIPGLRFNATIDTRTADGTTPAIKSA